MKLVVSLALWILPALGSAGCITSYNRPQWTARDGAPVVDRRAEGCHIDIFEDGQQVDRPHVELGRIVLEFPHSRLKEQGPEGAMLTLKTAACEKGAFLIKDLRGLSTGAVDSGLVYEGTLATLLGDDGQPLNLARGPQAPAERAPTPSPSGW